MATVDPFAQPYLDLVDRVGTLALDARGRLDAPVLACPDWTARTIVAHLAGLAEDWVAGRLDGYGSDDWTATQIARLDGVAVAELLSAWQASARDLVELTDSPMGGTPSMWAFGDAVVHEADLRPTLAPGSRVSPEAMAMGLKAAIARWRHHLGEAGLPPLLIQTPDGDSWKVGDTEADDVVTVTADRYELFRALFGRRSRQQMAAWAWSADSERYLDAGLPAPFRLADQDVDD